MKRSTGILALSGTALTLAAVGWRVSRLTAPTPSPGEPEVVRAAPAEEPAASEPVTRTPGCAFTDTADLAYAITIDAGARLGAAGGSLLRHTTAILDMRALSVDAKSEGKPAIFVARYRNVDDVTMHEAGDITAPFLLRIDGSCKLTGFARFETTEVREGRAQQAIAYELAWAWPGIHSGSGDASEMISENGVGAYRAQVRANVDGPRPTVDREIVAYTRIWANQSPRETRVAKSELRVDVGNGPWFESLRGTEKSPSTSSVEVETRVSAQRVAMLVSSFDGVPKNPSKYVWEDLLPRKVKPREMNEPSPGDAKALAAAKKLTLQEAVAHYEKRIAARANIADTWPDMKHFLEAHPEATGELVARLRNEDIADGAVAGVYIALGKAQTPEARDALLAINADTSATALDRSRSAFALVDRSDVGLELARRFQSDARSMSTAQTARQRIYGREAALALGVMSHFHAEDTPAIKTLAVDTAKELLAAGRSARQLSPAFGLIGNIGDAALVSLVVPYTKSADDAIRRVAVRALRRVDPDATAPLTTEWLARETSEDVKDEIYSLVHHQLLDAQAVAAPSIVQQAIVDLKSASSGMMRTSIIRVLATAQKESPAARAALVAQLKYELEHKEQGVLNVLTQVLDGNDLGAAFDAASISDGADPQ